MAGAEVKFVDESDLTALDGLFNDFAKTHDAAYLGNEESLRKQLLEDKISRCLICRNDGEPSGFLLFTPVLSTFKVRPSLFVNSVFVTDKHRNSSTFPRLLSALKSHAKDIHAPWIDGIVSDNNPMIAELKKLGNGKTIWHYVGRIMKPPLP